MVNLLKQFFTWWNRQTIGTFIYTLLTGKFVGKDEFENKYYTNRSGKRWVVYSGEIEATKISSDWYSWIHHINNKIEKSKDIKKYAWQKQSQPNKTGTSESYHPNKENNEIKKKYTSWKK